MTTAEMIAIMQAYEDGKSIQMTMRGLDDWIDVGGEMPAPEWNWYQFSYRIKPEAPKTTYRPYWSCDEMVWDFEERFCVKCPDYGMPLIWLKTKDSSNVFLVDSFANGRLRITGIACSFDELFNDFTYLDGSPAGMKVEL